MGIALHFDYKFELNGKNYQANGVDFGETEKEEDIADLIDNIEDLKIAAICNAFDINVDDYKERRYEFANAKFDNDYFEVYN